MLSTNDLKWPVCGHILRQKKFEPNAKKRIFIPEVLR